MLKPKQYEKQIKQAKKELNKLRAYDLALHLYAGLTNTFIWRFGTSKKCEVMSEIVSKNKDGSKQIDDSRRLLFKDLSMESEKYSQAVVNLNNVIGKIDQRLKSLLSVVIDSIMVKNPELTEVAITNVARYLKKFSKEELIKNMEILFIICEKDNLQIAEWLLIINLLYNDQLFCYDFETNSIKDLREVEFQTINNGKYNKTKKIKSHLQNSYDLSIMTLSTIRELDGIENEKDGAELKALSEYYGLVNPVQFSVKGKILRELIIEPKEDYLPILTANSTLYVLFRGILIHYLLKSEFEFGKLYLGQSYFDFEGCDLRDRKKVLRPEGLKLIVDNKVNTVFKEFHKEGQHILAEVTKKEDDCLGFSVTQIDDSETLFVSEIGIVSMAKLLDIFEIYSNSVVDQLKLQGYKDPEIELTTPKCWTIERVRNSNGTYKSVSVMKLGEVSKVIEVYAHVRKCNGQTSEEAKELAKKLNLTLLPGYTIVRTHTRHYRKRE